MPFSFRARCWLSLAALMVAGAPWLAAQNAFSPGGSDYAVMGALAGDQTAPHAAVSTNGGFLVCQDNGVDGDGLGIRATRLDASLHAVGGLFRVNEIGAGDQERPQVALLANGGAVFVWHGGAYGFQKIYTRYFDANGAAVTGDILVNTYTNGQQIRPAVATLPNGTVIVVWASDGEDGSRLGVYGQRRSATGQKLGSEFKVNQFIVNNQRTPAVAALSTGGFVVTWVSELQRSQSSIDIYARLYDAAGVVAGNEFPVNPLTGVVCANPSVAGSPNGGFAVAWSQKDQPAQVSGANQYVSPTTVSTNGWDVYFRLYGANGTALGGSQRLNGFTYGDQFAPRVAAFGRNYLATWISLGQDGSREGIYAQFFNGGGALEGIEFRVNTTAVSRQIHPAVATDGFNRFMVVWSSYVGASSFDLQARAYEIIRTDLVPEAGGMRLTWNTQPGSVYQVQSSVNFSSWTNVGAERTAAGYADSVLLNPPASGGGYRVIRVR
ncbi:MAG: hypothetical protein HY301_14815 [Verrucomicrobia bacterium]|nr:hypothetical protein [Verrucomicrobiota bacterium]